ncbi:LysR family transcriptional regulator [Actinorhabdospora filicis]|uniref:LysR family transcriptional regulator n=1 Tax=Actinorhabdospora filicis TaxID=1785913 RepID=A0A9W6SIU7_9ACTN|nr:LysR family transcriptional regulator [Actinorhabdospora filicis]GLZ77875.1 LysR family transcriptional regulator [Actinorhabdospora filicis]
MLDVRRLRLLRDLARLKTIAAVARAHSYSASAVSQQLTLLQREAGVELLARDGRGVRLTPAGAALVAHAETVLAALEAADATLAAARGGLRGMVRIGAFPTAVRTLLPAALASLARDHPGLDLMVSELDPVAMPDALRERVLDVALVHDYDLVPAAPDPTLDATPLLEETVYLAVPAHAGELGLPGAREADWILGTPGTLCHTVALRACEAAGYTPRVRHHVDDFTAVLALVAAGLGVALVPQLGVAEVSAAVRLLPLPIRRRTSTAHRRGAGGHPAVAACAEAVRAATEGYLRGLT